MVILSLRLKLLNLNNMNKTVKFILEAIKLVITAALGYFGGNAVM